MKPRTTHVLAPVLMAGAVSAVVLTHSDADELLNRDPAGDVVYYDASDGIDNAFPGTVVGSRRSADLTRFTVRHGTERIRVSLKFRDLNRRDPVLVIQGRFRWPQGGALQYAEAVVTAKKSSRAGIARLTLPEPCHLRHRLNYVHNRATLSFSTACLSNPRWVQFNALAFTTDSEKAPTYVYADHLFPVYGDAGDVERYTRRIRRG